MVKQTSSQTIKFFVLCVFLWMVWRQKKKKQPRFPVCIYEAKAFYDESS